MGKREKQIILNYQHYDSTVGISLEWKKLIEATTNHITNAYAPYSKFLVSSGILLSNNTIHLGGNVENASYPVGTCAERNVISHVTTNHNGFSIKALAIYGQHEVKQAKQTISPCGMCRQAILEAEHQQKMPISIILILSNTNFTVFNSAQDLLPFAFDKSAL